MIYKKNINKIVATLALVLLWAGCHYKTSFGGDNNASEQSHHVEELDRKLTVGMQLNADSILSVIDSLQMSGRLAVPLADYERGMCYALMEKRRIAEYYYKKALGDSQLYNLWSEAYYRASTNLSILLSGKNDEQGAMRVATEALGRLTKSGEAGTNRWESALLFNIGSSQMRLGYYEDGKKTLRNSLDGIKELVNKDGSAEVLRLWASLAVNIATIFSNTLPDEQEPWILEADKAVTTVSKSREIPAALCDMLRSKVASLKALYYISHGHTEKARQAYSQYLATDYAKMPQTLIEQLTFLEKADRWQEAAQLLPDIWKLHEEMGTEPNLDYLSDLAEGYVVNRKAGLDEEALEVADNMAAMVDSVQEHQRMDNAQELAVIYETQRKEAQLLRQQWKMRRQQGAAVAVILTLLLIAVGIYALMRRRTTRLLRRKNEELAHKNKELARLYQTKQNFLNNISHEMRTPLNAIVGFSQVLLTPGLELTDEEYDDMEKRIRESSKLLTDIVDKMIELSYYDTMSEVERIDTVELKTLCKEVMYGYLSSVKPDVKLRLTDDGGAVYTVVTNRDILQRVLRHLMDNAVKFTEKGEIVMGIYLLKTGGITISVTDTGCGIPESRRKEVFELFSETGEQVRTTGMGLNICRTMMRLLQGTISLDENYKLGTRMLINIPYSHISNSIVKVI